MHSSINSMKCSHCNATQNDLGHSMTIVLQKVDNYSGYSFMQCEQGQPYAGLSHQHFCCSPTHMVNHAIHCVNNHYQEKGLLSIPVREVRLHKTVLGAGLRCKICGQVLTTQAYRFCLTHATPINSVPDDSQNELGEWCCTLEHAKNSALKTLGRMTV